MSVISPVLPTRDVIRHTLETFGGHGPRYTSYPSADRFVTALSQDEYAALLQATGMRANRPLSLYFHLPFCAHLCWYCGCNKVVTRDHGRSAKYIRYDAYVQNVRTLDAYYAALDTHQLPVLRGHRPSTDDQRRAEIIQALMCHFTFDITAFEMRHGVNFGTTYASALAQLAPLEVAGLVNVDATRITVTPLGRHLVRRVAMVFDAYLSADVRDDLPANDCTPTTVQPLRYSRIV